MKIKRNKKSYRWFLCGLILVVVLTISYRVSKANYRIFNSIELTTGKVVSSSYDFSLISMYIDGVEQDKDTIIPDSGYAINEEQSYCYKESKNNKDNNARLFTDSLGNHVFKGISKGSKCIIYFDKTKTMEYLLTNYYTDKRVRTSENKDFNIPYEETTSKTIFSALDDDGTSYYFAGNPTDNWIEFGRYYWRIIRVNGDGSIRMIYQGRVYDENGNKLAAQATGEETQIGTFSFSLTNAGKKNVGYIVENDINNPSNAYTNLNNWFANSNIKQGSSYFNLIDPNAGFCGDRTSYIDGLGNNLGVGTYGTYYGTYIRLFPLEQMPTLSSKAIIPTYNCADSNDLYTYNRASKGNKVIANPVGMITADETSYAGLLFDKASTNYLNTGKSYWTISPSDTYGGDDAVLTVIRDTGSIGRYHGMFDIFGIRPVINIRSDVEFTGDGTISNPYKVI